MKRRIDRETRASEGKEGQRHQRWLRWADLTVGPQTLGFVKWQQAGKCAWNHMTKRSMPSFNLTELKFSNSPTFNPDNLR